MSRSSRKENLFDVLIIGAGFAGIYMLKKCHEMGLRARILEAAPDVGGTWFWNRYPGARCDVESLEYSYSFSDELQREWVWPERYSAQKDIQRYIRHVAEKFSLLDDIRFNTRVVEAHYKEDQRQWHIKCHDGASFIGTFCIMATGCLSSTHMPDIAGIEGFSGSFYHTGKWPESEPDFSGMRVGVIGTGSSAVQLIPIIARQCRHLYVFQRTANFVVPAHNRQLDPDVEAAHKANYPERRRQSRQTPFCIGGHPAPAHYAHEASAEERNLMYEKKWQTGGAISYLYSYKELLVDPEANETAGSFVRQKIRSIVRDPQTAEDLCPNDHYIGTKRLCLGDDYYETYNRDNVTLVNIRTSPIRQVTSNGVVTDDNDYQLDAMILATGFDAMTGSLFAIDIRGRGAAALREKWRYGPLTYLGLMTAGFPNMFFVAGSGSPSVKTNMVCAIEQHVEWISDCIQHMVANRLAEISCSEEAERQWTDHVAEVGNATLYPTAKSWYSGDNIPGKSRVFTPYVGGLDVYRKKCDDVASSGYTGFRFIGSEDRRLREGFFEVSE